MAKPKKSRPIRFDQFKKQLADAGVDELQPVELNGEGDKVYIKLGVGVDIDDTTRFMDRIGETETEDEAALIILDYNPNMSAEDQLELVKANGYTSAELIALWAAATGDMKDEMGKLRPRRS